MTQTIANKALRIIPQVAKVHPHIEWVLAGVYGIVSDNPSPAAFDSAIMWGVAHHAHQRDMWHQGMTGNRWHHIVKHYFPGKDATGGVGFYAEAAIVENLLLYLAPYNRSHSMEYNILLGDRRLDADFMGDCILEQQIREKVFRWGVQLTTQTSGSGKKRGHLLKRELHDRGFHAPLRSRRLSHFLRDHTMIINVPLFQPSITAQEDGFQALIKGDIDRILQTSIIQEHEVRKRKRWEREGILPKDHKKLPTKHTGRQIIRVLQYFHQQVVHCKIGPYTPRSHHDDFSCQTEFGERISARVFKNGSVPTVELKLVEPSYEWKGEKGDKPKLVEHTPVIITIPIPMSFIHQYMRCFG